MDADLTLAALICLCLAMLGGLGLVDAHAHHIESDVGALWATWSVVFLALAFAITIVQFTAG